MIPGDVAGRVVDDLLAVGAVAGGKGIELALELGFGVGGVDERGLVRRPVAGRPAGEPGELAAAGVADGVHLEEEVVGGSEPGGWLGSGSGGPVDVGNAEVGVPDDDPVGAGPLDPGDVVRRDGRG